MIIFLDVFLGTAAVGPNSVPRKKSGSIVVSAGLFRITLRTGAPAVTWLVSGQRHNSGPNAKGTHTPSRSIPVKCPAGSVSTPVFSMCSEHPET